MTSTSRVLVLLAGGAVALVSAGVAAASCVPTRPPYNGVYHDVWEAGTAFDGSVCEDGSRANIAVKSPYIYSNWDSIWTGILDAGGKDSGQVGYQKESDGTLQSFSETFYGTSGDVIRGYSSVTGGSDPQYKVTYSSEYMHYFVEGANVDNVQIYENYPGCESEQGGEIHNKKNQLSGTAGSHEVISNANARNSNIENWFTPNWSGPFTKPDVTWLGNSSPQSDELDIWDTCAGS